MGTPNRRLQRTRLRTRLRGGHAFVHHRGVRKLCSSPGVPLKRSVSWPRRSRRWRGTQNVIPVVVALAVVLAPRGLQAQSSYFPPGQLSERAEADAFITEWYSGALAALREPSLLQNVLGGCETYRFLWLRTFDPPIALRLEGGSDGWGVLTVKVADGTGGYNPGTLHYESAVAVNPTQVQRLRVLLDRAGFWESPTQEPMTGTVNVDGARWVFEATKEGRYHVLDRWSPSSGPYRAAALLLVRLARLQIRHVY